MKCKIEFPKILKAHHFELYDNVPESSEMPTAQDSELFGNLLELTFRQSAGIAEIVAGIAGIAENSQILDNTHFCDTVQTL